MSEPAAESSVAGKAVETAPQDALTVPTEHSSKPDQILPESSDAPEELLRETEDTSAGSEKATSSRSKRSRTSDVSETSTLEYSQTPFDEYTHQVKELCHLLWPSPPKILQAVKISRVERLLGKNRVAEMFLPKRSHSARASTPPPKEFTIHRLRGGGYNRIIGITINNTTDEEPEQLILRVPRFDNTRPDREVAVLRFMREYTTVPVPEIKHMDFTSNNPLKKCFVIMDRIPGHDLQDRASPLYYPNLNHEQKCTFTKEFALTLLKLHGIMHPLPGLIEASTDGNDDRGFTVRHLDLVTLCGSAEEKDLNSEHRLFQRRPFVEDWEPPKLPPLEQRTYYFMIAQFGRWRAMELSRDPAVIVWSKHYDRLATMAMQMDELGFLGYDLNCLTHLDLVPRNIMADIKSDGSLSITGILDWDSAIFAPEFVGCSPPSWLWAWNEDEDEDYEKHANDTPSNPEDREIKKVFEETVGDSFLSYAYKPEYRLARVLFRYAQSGITSSTDFEEIEVLLKDWAEIYESRMAETGNEATTSQDGVAEDATEEGHVTEDAIGV